MIDQVHTAGDEVTFTCQATSEPISTIQWYFNDIPLNESDKYEISTELLNYNNKISELTVKRVESSDVGTYTCYAVNGISVDNSSGVLSVNGMSLWDALCCLTAQVNKNGIFEFRGLVKPGPISYQYKLRIN